VVALAFMHQLAMAQLGGRTHLGKQGGYLTHLA
jgi:hypothetical protein